MRIARPIVPTDADLLDDYTSWAELVEACDVLDKVNGREHRITRRPPADMVIGNESACIGFPRRAFTTAFGETRKVSWSSTIASAVSTHLLVHRLASTSRWRGSMSMVIVATRLGQGIALKWHDIGRHGDPTNR